MPAICGGNVAFAEWPNVGTFKHFLELLDIINDAFDIHPGQYSGTRPLRDLANFFGKSRADGAVPALLATRRRPDDGCCKLTQKLRGFFAKFRSARPHALSQLVQLWEQAFESSGTSRSKESH